MRIKKIHYVGGVEFAGGKRLHGFPACCTGKQAERIRESGIKTLAPAAVTCQKCLDMLDKQEAYRMFKPGYWQKQRVNEWPV